MSATNITVIILNGYPRAGKDTLIRFMTDVAKEGGLYTEAFSSIDPVRRLLRTVKIDVERKTPEDRHLLAEMGNLLENHSEFRSQRCLQFVKRAGETMFRLGTENALLFLHIREPVIIERVREQLHADGVKVWRVMLDSNRHETPTNEVDAGVNKMTFDYKVRNFGTLGQLYDEATALVNLVLKRPLPKDVSIPIASAQAHISY